MDDRFKGVPEVQPGPLPFYYQIMQVLRGRIASGAFKLGDRLPTDEELQRQFGVSRHTARTAVQHLVADGLVRRYPGRGTFVVRREADRERWAIRSLEDVIRRRSDDPHTVLSVKRVAAKRAPKAAEALQVTPEDTLLQVCAQRSGQEGPYTYSRIYLPVRIGDRLPPDFPKTLGGQPLLRVVEQATGLPAHRTVQVATVGAVEAEPGRRLGLKASRVVLILERTFYTRDGQPLEFAEVYCHPERYSQTIEIVRSDYTTRRRAGRAGSRHGGPARSRRA